MLVAGVDENGLGPGLGPLIVTAVVMEVRGSEEKTLRLDGKKLPPGIADSKMVFRRSPISYSAGEAAALATLASAGRDAQDLTALLTRVTRNADLGGNVEGGRILHVAPLALPVWGGNVGLIATALAAAGVHVLDVACRVLLPAAFNAARMERGGKLALDYLLFEEALCLLEPRPALTLLGKIGGTRRYRPWLDTSTRFTDVETLHEEAAESRYQVRFDGRPTELRFTRDGDATYLPIAVASVVGKYLREAIMLCLNRALGFDGTIPHASGYWSDPKTQEAIDRFDERLADSIPRGAFLRDG
jgi:ribonuclease HII